MLRNAQEIIQEQAEIMAMHGIETADGGMEERRKTVLNEIENNI